MSTTAGGDTVAAGNKRQRKSSSKVLDNDKQTKEKAAKKKAAAQAKVANHRLKERMASSAKNAAILCLWMISRIDFKYCDCGLLDCVALHQLFLFIWIYDFYIFLYAWLSINEISFVYNIVEFPLSQG
jgi:hypothetical protein